MSDKSQNNDIKNFIRNEYNRLVSYIRSNLDNYFFKSEPEDIIQDVALNILSRQDYERPIENISGFFYRAIKNRIIDLQRQKKRTYPIVDYENVDDESFLSFVLQNAISDEDSPYGNSELQKIMMEAIEQLKPDQKTIIYETEFNDHTFNELSEKWKIPIGTLLSRKRRAIQKLKQILLNDYKKLIKNGTLY